jgi:hypothetical protein
MIGVAVYGNTLPLSLHYSPSLLVLVIIPWCCLMLF